MLRITLLSALLTLPFTATASAEIENEISWGVEGVTGYRTSYVSRGFKLAEGTLDFQLEGQIALSDQLTLNLGGWYATESGKGDFEEIAGLLKLRHQTTEHLTLGADAIYRSEHQSIFKDGVDLGLNATWNFCRDFGITLGASYDTGADGWYGNLESVWTKALNDKTFFSLKSGISAVSSFYDRDGFNDVYGRLSLTYNISDHVSFSPYVGGSVLLDNNDEGDDTIFGGIWFIVRF